MVLYDLKLYIFYRHNQAIQAPDFTRADFIHISAAFLMYACNNMLIESDRLEPTHGTGKTAHIPKPVQLPGPSDWLQ